MVLAVARCFGKAQGKARILLRAPSNKGIYMDQKNLNYIILAVVSTLSIFVGLLWLSPMLLSMASSKAVISGILVATASIFTPIVMAFKLLDNDERE